MTLEAGEQFEALLEFLRENRGFDFTGYKRTTMVRRVAKRCAELGIDSFGAYTDYLEVHPEEFEILFDKILINVTDFFRDKNAWDYLENTIVPGILRKHGTIRVWSAGTASGEEAYSVAMVLCEALGPEAFLQRVKIYATDIDDEALNKARAGYSAKELEPLSSELRMRYFESSSGRHVFRSSLRRSVIFGRHDLVQDAPISRLDLLICRNTLMYLTAETQGRVLARFHYALNDDGYLFLGKAEMLLTHASLFVPVELKERIFTKVQRLQLRDRLSLLAQAGTTDTGDYVGREVQLRDLASEGAPFAQIVVDPQGRLVLANHPARRMFNTDADDIGRPLKDLGFSRSPADLTSPIAEAFRDRRPALISGVGHVMAEGNLKQFDIQFAPLLDAAGDVVGVSVSFVDVTNLSVLRADLERSKQEVETAYEELQSSNEELETTNEELQSTVEELETTNEELQSSNEELETMNEELESTNTELEGINTDLRQRTDEVDRLNTFLNAILGNIPLAAVVLDPDLDVRFWNAQAADLWGVRSDEVVGQQFLDLDIGFPTKEMRPIVKAVVRGKGSNNEVVVDAITRRGKKIRCRVMVSTLAGGDRPSGVVLVMEEVRAEGG